VTARPPFPFDTFVFAHRAIEGRRVRLGYALTSRSGGRVEFEETLELPDSLDAVAGASDPAVARALLGLHLAAGTSYWKTCIPREVEIAGAQLGADDAEFWTTVYTHGLGEFFYRNELDPTDRIVFRDAGGTASSAPVTHARGPALLLWGGGKDSAVSHEVLALAGEPHELLSVGRANWTWVRRAAEVAGAPLHVAGRRIDPKLLEMNAAGALNGHVPVSAYLAFAGLLAALVSGRSAVIASNEASASSGNASWHGIDVNHQWSKSLEFERMARAWVARQLTHGPEYVSLLRPLSELRIVKAFATHPAYFGVATSCNGNFRQDGAAARRWCLACAKCVFVALMARPWLDDGAYHALFGGDPLADPANATLVEELLGIRGTKPFECVGTPEETIAALHLARRAGRSLPHGVMTMFANRIGSQPFDGEALASRTLARTSEHELSPARLAALDAYLDRH
jgi:UDP-N-acetyl-alpha-D-muramoyl-L-alanyl-L-glutamate epimerase